MAAADPGDRSDQPRRACPARLPRPGRPGGAGEEPAAQIGALPIVELGPTEGQPAAAGTFRSAPIDTAATGSNVFGLLLAELTGGEEGVDLAVEFAADADGPWSPAAPVVDERPVPLDADGLRWVRFSGAVDAPGVGIVRLGIEHDLEEAPSADATSTLTVPGPGTFAALRVRGSIGAPGVVEVAESSTAGVVVVASQNDDLVPSANVEFDGVSAHHLVVVVDDGVVPTAATSQWAVTDGLGLTVVHDLVVVVEGA